MVCEMLYHHNNDEIMPKPQTYKENIIRTIFLYFCHRLVFSGGIKVFPDAASTYKRCFMRHAAWNEQLR